MNSANVLCQVEGNPNPYMEFFLSKMLVQYNGKVQLAFIFLDIVQCCEHYMSVLLLLPFI